MNTHHSDDIIADRVPPSALALAQGLEQYFSKHLQQGDYINWLALYDDEIIATGGICFYNIPPDFLNATSDSAYILNVYTLPAYRRQGISKHLFEKLIQEAKDRNVAQVYPHTTDDGKALYEQFGFKLKENEMVWQHC
jgi:GNAT superfamily N-acetyltransferase